MSKDLALEARNKAGDYFRHGYNCAESIFLAFRDLVAPELDAGLVKMFTVFGGGLGRSGCVCGALSSAEAIIGLFKGRVDNNESLEPCYEASSEFYKLFKERFGGTCCRVLNTHPFDSPEHLRNCLKITGGTGKLLMGHLVQKGMVS